MNAGKLSAPLILLFSVISFSLQAQEEKTLSSDIRKLDRKGQKQIDNKEWIEAKTTYKKLLREQPKDQEYNFLMGLATFKSGIQKERAERYFESISSKEIPQKNYFYGQSLLYNEKFDEAVEAFEKFKPLIDDNEEGQKLMAEVENYIRHATNGIELIQYPDQKLRVDLLGDGVNTEKSEYAPVI